MNLMQQMYFAFATSFKTNNFFALFMKHTTHTHKTKTKKLTTNTIMLMK